MEDSKNKKPRVFYLDDDEINLAILEANLEDYYEIIGFSDPNKSIKFLKKNEVDVILTDQIMPLMDGIEFLQAIQNIQPNVGRILLTGVVNHEVMLQAINKVNIYRFHEKSDNFDGLKFDIDNAFQMVVALRQKDYYYKQLIETSEKLKIISDNVPAQIIHTDLDGNILEINQETTALTKASIGKNISDYLPDDELKKLFQTMARVVRTKKSHNIITRAFNFYENFQWFSTVIGPLHSKNELSGFLMVSQDITDRINHEEKIMSAVIEAEDRQKSKIARDIHDGLQQTLTIALLNFESLDEQSIQISENELEKFKQGVKFLRKGLQETRSIAYELIPKSVEDFGFVDTIKELIGEFNNTLDDTEFNFYTNLDKRIEDLNIEYNLFRITQESLNNIIKYANATEVFVQLTRYDNILQLTIEDNGKGFDVEKKLNSDFSFGLFNMNKRAESLSGKMTIESKDGTLVFVEIPLRKKINNNSKEIEN
ncbi:response regulator [Marivirga harenae]|uniref:response regulator n=1 Tax=Marivirga harenae TaxID=2010992 RepID=UPI0026E092F4|nr:response regulator [Marivirga harenae]WKV10840.1 response regulator [Marivirga harenae]|tara:strand:+ start:117097 stop:118545 length:1449 start_codon:yes stop_codon:yes gene_type:complete